MISLLNKHKFPPKLSYAQAGEDLIIKFIFDALKNSKPSYIDIGAHHPYFLSNTALFYSLGCRGINIEADAELCKVFTKLRKNDQNLNIGIGKENATLDFYMISSSTLNTFSKSEALNYEKQGFEILAVKPVEVLRIDQVIDRYANGKFPDFLSLDVEGMDMEIISTIDFSKSAPDVICVETISYAEDGKGIKNHEIINYLNGKGYMTFADTYINTIFVKKTKWERSTI